MFLNALFKGSLIEIFFFIFMSNIASAIERAKAIAAKLTSAKRAYEYEQERQVKRVCEEDLNDDNSEYQVKIIEKPKVTDKVFLESHMVFTL